MIASFSRAAASGRAALAGVLPHAWTVRLVTLRRGLSRTPQRGPVDIRPGRLFAPGEGRDLPIVVIVATGMEDGDAEPLARAVETAQAMTGSFRPLFVVDGSDLDPFRSRQFAVEHVVPEAEFTDLNPDDSWFEYLFDRVAGIARSYRAQSVVPLPAGAPDAVADHLLRLVGLGHRMH